MKPEHVLIYMVFFLAAACGALAIVLTVVVAAGG